MQANKTRNGSHRKYFQGTTENGTNSDRILHQTSGGKVTNTKNTLFIVRKLTLLLIVLSYDYIGVLNCMAYKWLTLSLWCTLETYNPSSSWLSEEHLCWYWVAGLPSDPCWWANPVWNLDFDRCDVTSGLPDDVTMTMVTLTTGHGQTATVLDDVMSQNCASGLPDWWHH